MFTNRRVLVRSGGDLASAVIQKLHRAGFTLVVSELEKPMMVRRTVSFSNAVYEGEYTVEDIKSVHVTSREMMDQCIQDGHIPIITLPEQVIITWFRPEIFIDATLSKKKVIYQKDDFDMIIGLGPDIEAGVNADIVIETCRGHDLGRLIFSGFAIPNTSIPGFIDGFAKERVLRAPTDGVIDTDCSIGDYVTKGDAVMTVDSIPVYSQIDGVIRGLIHPSVRARKGLKVGDVDPRGSAAYCHSISDKGRNIAGGVLEAILILMNRAKDEN
jgi:xanthine dehydrogenase accessory factor